MGYPCHSLPSASVPSHLAASLLDEPQATAISALPSSFPVPEITLTHISTSTAKTFAETTPIDSHMDNSHPDEAAHNQAQYEAPLFSNYHLSDEERIAVVKQI
ncbi:hypothetical protein CPC08DRAFT_771479 [Agrocybe pediades]|nr:hypothetical protein CPC08DRAFT_771479 [Agrocybe pediades]